ncbi:sensor histidine kinase [Rhodococcus sp. H29-C3]|uniref:sensor histidine kinase n=1 Tax=Rhodococcus sp. H29-C3 TaxID=3046307 RepID=UPI0024BBB837|nr:sensor histidine kinase [Rhodococcus sp. H29-C3]MDJ0360193.1 sensor histidine kinase [Rhodococcus sp. H29-C3]
MTKRSTSVAAQVLLLQLAVIAVVVFAGGVLTVLNERSNSDEATSREVVAVAVSIANEPSTPMAIASDDPTAILQPETERIRKITGVDFIVVMAPDRTRFTHTTVDLIGKPFSGNIDDALRGETITETYVGSLGPSIRSVTPVTDTSGNIVGLVSAGVTRAKISEQFVRGLPMIFAVVLSGFAVAAVGSILLSRRLRRQTLGMAPAELRTMYGHHDAVLHSIGEGLVVFGDGESAELVNDEARRLLDLEDGPVTRASLPESMQSMDTGIVRGELHLTDSRVLFVNQDPVMWEGTRLGQVLSIRDRTELQNIMGELDSVRSFAESLRSQAHESANRLHTVITMVELGRSEEAVEFATADLELSQHLIDRLMASVQEPALAALLLGKMSQAAEQGVELTVTEDTALGPVGVLTPRELVTVVGNLIDNAIDASKESEQPWVEVTVRDSDEVLIVRVADSGPGMSPETLRAAMTRGYSTKADSRGLGLALVTQIVNRHRGEMTSEVTYGSVLLARIPAGDRS